MNGYYDVFYKQFLFTNTNDGYNYNKEADNLASYQKLIKELLGLKAEIDQLTKTILKRSFRDVNVGIKVHLI